MYYFKEHDTFTLDGDTVNILKQLGEGGQGEVYLVNYCNKQYAFKLYKPDVFQPGKEFKDNMKRNIENGSPYQTFLWPQEFIEFDDGKCGYLMDLVPSNYVSFVSYMNGKSKFKDYKTMLKWCIELVNSFKVLHEKGYSYQDLNDGSFFLDPNTGSLLICDTDNVSADKTNLGIEGKLKYMAPEIVRGDKDRLTGLPQMPDSHSDRFSLAIILFLTLCLGNPFQGERLKNYPVMGPKEEEEMYGINPIYIYSQYDSSNRPIRGYHTVVINRYERLPPYIKDAFHKTFTDGMRDRENSRTTEIEWIKLLCRYRDEIVTCSCGHEYYYGFYDKKNNLRCPKCGQPRKFCYLHVGKNRIVLEPGKGIYKFHLDKYSNEYNSKIGKVIQSKNNPGIWGIALKLPTDVEIKDSCGNVKVIAKDGVIKIVDHLKIKFPGETVGEIVSN